jgi:hypothetical protein
MAMLMMVDLSPDAWWTFSAPFLYISTHASVRRFDNKRAFSVSLQTCSAGV